MTSILVIEDEASIRRFLRPALESAKYAVVEADTAATGLKAAAERHPAVVLLDLGLPDRDGLEVIRSLREWSAVPIIVLTARGKEQDRVRGLDAGADDYLTKPFGIEELQARIRVALRHAAGGGQEPEPPVFKSGDLIVDRTTRTVRVGGREVHLTPYEYELLVLLVRHAGKVVTQKQILKAVWDQPGTDQGQIVRLFIHQIRAKIETNPARPKHIQTEPGVGYRLRVD